MFIKNLFQYDFAISDIAWAYLSTPKKEIDPEVIRSVISAPRGAYKPLHRIENQASSQRFVRLYLNLETREVKRGRHLVTVCSSNHVSENVTHNIGNTEEKTVVLPFLKIYMRDVKPEKIGKTIPMLYAIRTYRDRKREGDWEEYEEAKAQGFLNEIFSISWGSAADSAKNYITFFTPNFLYKINLKSLPIHVGGGDRNFTTGREQTTDFIEKYIKDFAFASTKNLEDTDTVVD